MRKTYTMILHESAATNDIGVSFPDFPGCISAGSDVQEAIEQGKEALEFYLEFMVDEEIDIPLKGDEKALKERLDECNELGEKTYISLVQVEIPESKIQRYNISMNQMIINKVDRWAKEHKTNRSQVLAEAAMEFMTAHA